MATPPTPADPAPSSTTPSAPGPAPADPAPASPAPADPAPVSPASADLGPASPPAAAPAPASPPVADPAAPLVVAPTGVVVGVDGSDGSLWALDRAFTEAAALALPLHVLSVVNPAPGAYATGVAELAEESAERLRQGMLAVTERAVATVVRRHPAAAPPALHVVLGDPVETLLAASARHHTLIVGARGNGGFSRLLLGSVASALVHHAACPVLLVPARNTPEPVPVG
ncbi:universal stress protein [Streptacidiphilus cavernicola]|uniref:Universal stress protein n=1 Tax=Streptacidiphilus cavernicola TaxID=3342716 RepID=A0ABV6VXU2_9ACTN